MVPANPNHSMSLISRVDGEMTGMDKNVRTAERYTFRCEEKASGRLSVRTHM